MKKGLTIILILAITIVSFSLIQDSFARNHDYPLTVALKAEVERASPILQTGFISTSTNDYVMSNQFEIRHARVGDLMRISGLTVEGHPFYAIHKYDLGDIQVTGKIFVNNKFVSLSQNQIVVAPEPVIEIAEASQPIKTLVSVPQSTYWRQSMTIDLKVFEEDQNKFNDFWYREYLVPNVPILIDVTHENGKHLFTIEGVTNEKGYFKAEHYVIENLSLAGKYIIRVESGDETNKNIQEFQTFIIGEIVGGTRSNSTS